MKFKIATLALIISSLTYVSCGSDEPNVCETTRYASPTFTEVSRSNIVYSTAKSVLGQDVPLSMDIYQPAGDKEEKRPLIIWAHGGSFVSGSRLDVQSLCEEGTKRGFVTASIDYRLLGVVTSVPDSLIIGDVAIKAIQDMKAAIRFFRKDAATNNRYKIDPEQIYIGGVSAGGIIALSVAYMKDDDLTIPYLKKIVDTNGGLNEGSGDADARKYSTAVNGVINLSGAILSLDFIDSGEPPVYSFHGNADDVVPYEFGFARVGAIPIVRLFGSKLLTDQAKKVGVTASLTTIQGGGHTNIYTEASFAPARNTFNNEVYGEFKKLICK